MQGHHFLLNGTWSPILTSQHPKLKVLRKNKITYSSFDLFISFTHSPVQAGRCNSAMQHVIVVYSRRQIGFSVCPSSILKFKNERGKKIVTGAGSQVFSDRLGYPYFYLVDSMGAHRRARIHQPCSALPGRAPANATCYPPLPIHQKFRTARTKA